MGYEIAVIPDDNGTYYCIEDPDFGYDTEERAAVVLISDEYVGGHQCTLTGTGGDGYADGLQDEESLPEGIYVVMYYRIIDGQPRNEGDYYSFADYRITKEQIIANAASGKYVDGACYYLVG